MLWQPKTENSPKEAEPDVKNKYIAVKGKTKRGPSFTNKPDRGQIK